jgi:hypothetical protein
MALVTPKAADKLELWFNKTYLKDHLKLVCATLCVTKLIYFQIYKFGHTLLVFLSSTLMLNKKASEASWLNKSSSLAEALSMAKFKLFQS